MNALTRRQFCTLIGAGLAGATVIAGCSNSDDGSPVATPASTGAGSLAGVSFAVRRDPG